MDPRILYLSANGFPWSEEEARGAFSLEHARALQAKGAHVIAVDLARSAFSQCVRGGLTILGVPRLRPLLRQMKLRSIARYVGFFFSLRSTAAYDFVIFSFFYSKYIPIAWLLKRRGVRVLVIAHGGDVMPVSRIRRVFKKVLFRTTDLVTPVSEYTETLFSCLVGRKATDNSKILTIPNGVDLGKLYAQTVSRAAMRMSLGIESDEFVILSICNLVKRKGVEVLIRAIHLLLQKGMRIRHLVIGSGPELHNLTALANAHGDGRSFIFIPSVRERELGGYYDMCDLFSMISTTDWGAGQTEGFGMTYAEAMAMGRPVIGGASCGASTPVKHGFNGFLVNPLSCSVVEDVSIALEKFVLDSEYYTEMSRNARWYIENFLTWERNAESTLEALQRLHPGQHRKNE